MIKNERQYKITNAQLERFEQALEQLLNESGAEIHPLLRRAQEGAMRSQIEELRAELEEYDGLKAGRVSLPALTSFEEVPISLIRARIASGLSQKQLAAKLGLKEQQIQQYEATEYASASITRIREVIAALGIVVAEDVVPAVVEVSWDNIFKQTTSIGLDNNFVINKLIPRSVTDRIQAENNGGYDKNNMALQVASLLGRIFNTEPDDFFAPTQIQLERDLVGTTRFKTASRVNEQRLAAYTFYAHYLALLVLDATKHLQRRPVPTEAAQVRGAINSEYGSLTLENTLRYVWGLGIPVLPLNDSGAFHGACWRIQGRNVIALKQLAHSEARWIVDLLHELFHAGEKPEEMEFTAIELDETYKSRKDFPEEEAASEFAEYVALDGRPEELADKCVQAAGRSIPRLKRVVPLVAVQENVRTDVLANYMAFRLSEEGQNWWGAAAALQGTDVHPWHIARDVMMEFLDFTQLNELDGELLQQALSS